MAAANVRKAIQAEVITICAAVVAQGVDDDFYVNLIDKVLPSGEVPSEHFPALIVNVRTSDQAAPGEMGTLHNVWKWMVHIYYLDVSDDYTAGEEKRDEIVERVQVALEQNPRLNNIRTNPDGAGITEYVYDSDFQSVLFDSSGQDGYYTFVAELYLNVDTARN